MPDQKHDRKQRFSGIATDELMQQYGEHFAQLPGEALAGRNAPTKVFAQIGRSAAVAHLFIPYWVQSKSALHLSVIEQELIILRSASLFNCDYVWGHHVPVMLEAGMPMQQINHIPLAIDQGNWPEKHAALLRSVDQLFANANLQKSHWEALKKYYNDSEILDIITVCSQYLLFNAVNNVFNLTLEHKDLPRLPLFRKL